MFSSIATRQVGGRRAILAAGMLAGAMMLGGCQTDSATSTTDGGSAAMAESSNERNDFSVHLVATEQSDTMSAELVAGDGSVVWMDRDPLVRGSDIVEVSWGVNNDGRKSLYIGLSDEAGARMYAAADRYVEGYLAFMWKGDAVFVPRVMSAMSTQLMIFGADDGMSDETLDDIQTALNR